MYANEFRFIQLNCWKSWKIKKLNIRFQLCGINVHDNSLIPLLLYRQLFYFVSHHLDKIHIIYMEFMNKNISIFFVENQKINERTHFSDVRVKLNNNSIHECLSWFSSKLLLPNGNIENSRLVRCMFCTYNRYGNY